MVCPDHWFSFELGAMAQQPQEPMWEQPGQKEKRLLDEWVRWART